MIESLQVTWKLIRRAGYGKTKHTYCSYVIENEKHRHKLKTVEGTKLFDLLEKTVITHNPKTKDRFSDKIFVDAVYRNDELLYIKNPRKLG